VPRKIWLDGELVDAAEAKVSVFDHGLLYGDGVFEGIRLYNGRLFKMQSHLRRLFESARAIRLTVPWSLDALEEAIRATVSANSLSEGYIRLCVTRGVGTLGLDPFKCHDPTTFIIADTIQLYPQETYDQGMAVVTAATLRNHPAALSPRVKSMNYLNNILAKMEAIDAGVREAVMLNHQGFVAECTGDNIFVVRQDPAGESELLTPPLHAGVLEGITRNVVIELARAEGIPFREAELSRHDLYIAREMLLTGTAAEVVPVTRVDGRDVGEGTPGPVTRRLCEAFDALVRREAPED